MADEKTLGRLGARFNKPARQTSQRDQTSQKPKRARQSLFFADQTMKDIDEAYRKAEHDAYPEKINKAAFFEAMIEVALAHGEEVMKRAKELE